MPTKLVVNKYVDCSTVHITPADAKLLESGMLEHVVSYSLEGYGFFIYLSDEETVESINKDGFSKEFVELYVNARFTGATHLRLDCDGPEYEGRTTFEHIWKEENVD